MSSGDIRVHYVEVRSWPERSDVVVIDPASGAAISHYRIDDQPEGSAYSPIFDPRSPWATRSDAALRSLEENQAFVHACVNADDDVFVRLEPSAQPRDDIGALLADHGLSLQDVDVPNLACALRVAAKMPPEKLWELLADWYDRVERRYPPGSSRRDPESWVHRAHPGVARHFLTLADGDQDEALKIFREEADVPMGEFGLYHALMWIYFFRTEFAGKTPFRIGALDQVLGATGTPPRQAPPGRNSHPA